MFEKLLKNRGYISKKESLMIRQENFLLKDKVREFEKTPKTKPVLNLSIGDPIPENPTARREYIARCAAFHKDVLDNKLKSMISEIRAELEKVDSPPAVDAILKGTCNALWLLHEWGESCVNEMLSYQTDGLEEEETKLLKEQLEK